MRPYILGAAAAALFTAGLAVAQTGAAPTAPSQAAPASANARRLGYVPTAEAEQLGRFITAYPAAGSSAEAYDRAAHQQALTLADSARWRQAAADDPIALRNGLTVFQCAVGATLSQTNAPRLMTLLAKTQINAGHAVEAAKARFRRPRPYAGREEQARTCLAGVTPEQLRRGSTSYPGGHASLGMAWGLILAELAPDRTGEIMSRVQDFSYSRLVCGIHYPSDLAAGEALGAALVARLHADPDFRADLDAARAEVAAARQAQTSPPAGCPA